MLDSTSFLIIVVCIETVTTDFLQLLLLSCCCFVLSITIVFFPCVCVNDIVTVFLSLYYLCWCYCVRCYHRVQVVVILSILLLPRVSVVIMCTMLLCVLCCYRVSVMLCILLLPHVCCCYIWVKLICLCYTWACVLVFGLWLYSFNSIGCTIGYMEFIKYVFYIRTRFYICRDKIFMFLLIDVDHWFSFIRIRFRYHLSCILVWFGRDWH